MNVRTVCLSILYEGESTGYDIRKLTVEGEYSYFVDASFGAIYPALQKLEDEGLVSSRVEPQSGKPSRKVYAITQAGRNAFLDSLFDDIGDDNFRSPFLLFARFAAELPQSLVQQRLSERIAKLDSRIAAMERAAQTRAAPADRWIIEYGRACLAVARDHIEAHRGELIAMARPDTAAAAE
jgi:PadR family transcriptional regulator AphA